MRRGGVKTSTRIHAPPAACGLKILAPFLKIPLLRYPHGMQLAHGLVCAVSSSRPAFRTSRGGRVINSVARSKSKRRAQKRRKRLVARNRKTKSVDINSQSNEPEGAAPGVEAPIVTNHTVDVQVPRSIRSAETLILTKLVGQTISTKMMMLFGMPLISGQMSFGKDAKRIWTK